MYWLYFSPCFVHKGNNYHSWIFSLVSNGEYGVIDSNFDLQPISQSGLIIFSHYPVLFSIERLVFVLLAAAFTWFWCAPVRELQQRHSRLERTKVGTAAGASCTEAPLCFPVFKSSSAPRKLGCKLHFIVAAGCPAPAWSLLNCFCLPPWLSNSH